MYKRQLFERIVQVRFFDEVDAANLVRQMLSAISFLHNLDPPVVHRDLKVRAPSGGKGPTARARRDGGRSAREPCS